MTLKRWLVLGVALWLGTATADTNRGIERYFQHDYVEALEEFTAPDSANDPLAWAYLGEIYEYGLGVPADCSQAVEWYRKAAEQGNAFGQYNLGTAYWKGRGVPQDHGLAAQWLLKSAEQGLSDAQVNVALLYEVGQGAPKDLEKAIEWYRKAAAQGNAFAAAALTRLGR